MKRGKGDLELLPLLDRIEELRIVDSCRTAIRAVIEIHPHTKPSIILMRALITVLASE
jgi:hypothetical protein